MTIIFAPFLQSLGDDPPTENWPGLRYKIPQSEEAAEARGIGAGAVEVEPGFLVIAPPGIAVGGGG